jgi:hypothetical protein
VHASGRGRLAGDRAETMPWQGRFSNSSERGGLMVPLYGEVEWLTPEGPGPYFCGTFNNIGYEFSK